MTPDDDIKEHVDRTLRLAGVDTNLIAAHLVRGILEPLNVPPPATEAEFASLLQRIRDEPSAER